MGEEAARRLLTLLDDLKAISIVDADAGHVREVRARLDAQRGRKLTFVDASILVLLAKHRVGTVWGTDRDLGLEGASVVPGPPRG